MRPFYFCESDLRPKSRGNPRADVVLQFKYIFHFAVEPLGPEMPVTLGVDQLDVDSYSISSALHAPFDDVPDA